MASLLSSTCCFMFSVAYVLVELRLKFLKYFVFQLVSVPLVLLVNFSLSVSVVPEQLWLFYGQVEDSTDGIFSHNYWLTQASEPPVHQSSNSTTGLVVI